MTEECECCKAGEPCVPIGREDQKEADWLACVDKLPGYIEHLPAGHIVPIAGRELWVDSYGCRLTREQFIEAHGVDPASAWAAIKLYRKQFGGGVRVVRE